MRSNIITVILMWKALLVPAKADLIVYEGFDGTAGSVIAGSGTATDGWGGAWTGYPGSSNPGQVTIGQSFDPLPVIGGAFQRPTRIGKAAMNRQISAAAQTALTADDSVIFFSLLMASGSGSNGYALNTWGGMTFGNAGITTSSGDFVAFGIEPGGDALGVGFAGTPVTSGLYPDVRLQGMSYTDGTVTENAAERITVGESLVMIVGRIQWAANGSSDVMSLFRITDLSAPLPPAFATVEFDVDQTGFDTIGLASGQTAIFDEIRIGTTLESVGLIDDNVAPEVVALSPAPTTSDVATYADLTATFNEDILIGTGTIIIKNTSDNIDTFISLPDPQVTVDGSSLTIDLATNLTGSRDHAVIIGSGAITDLSGNPFGGISDSTTWFFTTGVPDVRAPMISTLSPDNVAIGVPLDGKLVLTFDEDILVGGGIITIKDLDTTSQIAIPASDAQVSATGRS